MCISIKNIRSCPQCQQKISIKFTDSINSYGLKSIALECDACSISYGFVNGYSETEILNLIKEYENSIAKAHDDAEMLKTRAKTIIHSTIPKLKKEMDELVAFSSKAFEIGKYRVYMEEGDFYPPVYTVHLGEAKLLHEILNCESNAREYMDTVNKLANAGLSFETENQCIAFLLRDKKQS